MDQEQEIEIISSNTRREKIKNFFVNFRKQIITFLVVIILGLFSYFLYIEYQNSAKENLAERFNLAVTKFEINQKENLDLEFKEMQFLYSDSDGYHFMDTKTYDQLALSKDEVEDTANYLIENLSVRVTFFKGKPVAIELDNFVELEVKETQPNIKGDTSSGGGKPATLETGLTITVPFHINAGDVLKIDTRTDKYVEKVK